MEYLLVALITIIATYIHWHYYRWCIYNIDINRPRAYRSPVGKIIVHFSKLVWFGVILYFFEWYYIFIPIIFLLFILKTFAASQSAKEVKKYWIKKGKSEKEAKELAIQEIRNYKH